MSYEISKNGIMLIWRKENEFSFIPQDAFLHSNSVAVAKNSNTGLIDLIFDVEGMGEVPLSTPLGQEEAEKMLHEYLSVEKPTHYAYELIEKGVRIYSRDDPQTVTIFIPYSFFRENPRIQPYPRKEDSCILIGSISGEMDVPLSPTVCQEMLTAVYNRLL